MIKITFKGKLHKDLDTLELSLSCTIYYNHVEELTNSANPTKYIQNANHNRSLKTHIVHYSREKKLRGK